MYLITYCVERIVYLQPWQHSWLQFKKQRKKWDWLLQLPAMVVIGCWQHVVCVFVGRTCVYIMCMHATVVYIYLCNCIEIFKFEAHLNMIIVPVCGVMRRCGGEGFTELGGGWLWKCVSVCGQCAVSVQATARWEAEVGCYLMIWGQSLQALAFRLARASQAGSVDTCGESLEGKRFDTSLTAGGDGVESAISTATTNQGQKMSDKCFSYSF